MAMDGHYDRAADIAWLRLEGWVKDRVRVEETGSGLVERDRMTGRVIGLEFWQASSRLQSSSWMRYPPLRGGTSLSSDSRRSRASRVRVEPVDLGSAGSCLPSYPADQWKAAGAVKARRQARASEPRSGGQPSTGGRATPDRAARMANAVNRYLSACALMACLPLGLCRE